MIRIGIVGLDSTHAVEFTRLIQSSFAAEAQVAAACPGIPTDFPLSVRRRESIAREVHAELGVPVLDSVQAVVDRVDALMLLGCDARTHVREAKPLLFARKPLFIDKPLSADWREAADLLLAARTAGTPCFSASALRYRQRNPHLRRPAALTVDVPQASEPGHPDLSWHGIHGVEAGFGILGPGCRSVARTVTSDADTTTSRWPDGSTLLIRRTTADSGRAFELTATGQASLSARGHDYRPLVAEIVTFFRTAVMPVSAAEMVEVLALIAAADLSRDQGGNEVDLASILRAVDL